MPENAILDAWLEAQEYQVPLNSQGKIIDFLEPDRLRENTPEERIRQKTGQFLHYELGYPKEIMAFERTVNIGADRTRVDIVIYHDVEARATNDQGRMFFIGETKSPLEAAPDRRKQLWWNYIIIGAHGEEAPPPTTNLLKQLMSEAQLIWI